MTQDLPKPSETSNESSSKSTTSTLDSYTSEDRRNRVRARWTEEQSQQLDAMREKYKEILPRQTSAEPQPAETEPRKLVLSSRRGFLERRPAPEFLELFEAPPSK